MSHRQKRQALQIAKLKTARKAKARGITITPKWLGVATSQHLTCSCWTCNGCKKFNREKHERMHPLEYYAC